MTDIEKINQYTQREFLPEEVFVFPLVLCDNDIDRDFEAFSDETLDTLAKLFVGKTGIFDHSHSATNQVARIFETEVVAPPNKKNALGMQYKKLTAKAYMVRTDENKSLITEIEGGIKKEVSVGTNAKSCVCSICSKEISLCSHHKGRKYKNQLCYGILGASDDAYEWSFVAVPSQRNAGVSKSFGIEKIKSFTDESEDFVLLSREEIDEISRKISECEEHRFYAEKFREGILDSVKKRIALTQTGKAFSAIFSIAESLDTEKLLEFSAEIEALTGDNATEVQLYSAEENNQYK